MKRPFQCWASANRHWWPVQDRLKTLWVDMFGLEVSGTYKSERETWMRTSVPGEPVRSRSKWT